MNKLISKIVGVCLGMSMAAGVGIGVAVGSQNMEVKPAEAATPSVGTTTYNLAFSNIGTTGWSSSYADHSYTAADDVVISMNASKQTSTITTVPVTKGQPISLVLPSNPGVYISAFSFTATQWGSKAQTMTAKYSTNRGSSYTSTGKTSTNFSISVSSSDMGSSTSVNAIQITFSSTSNQVGLSSFSVTYAASSTTTPSISVAGSATVAKDDSTSLSVEYANLTSTLNVSALPAGVATASLENAVSSGTGTVNLIINGVSKGTATVTLSSTGATDATVTVNVFESKEYTKITMDSKLVDGGHYLIAGTGTTKIMSLTQNSNNRGMVEASGSSPFDTLTTSNYGACELVISKGSGDYASYYTLFDASYNSGAGGYLYDPDETNKNYLRSDTLNGDKFYWTISFSDNHVVFTNKNNSKVIRFNSSNTPPIFSSYASTGSQSLVDLYLLTSELPGEKTISSFTMPSASISFENLDSYTFTASYSPTDASETVTASIQSGNVGSVTFGAVNMSNGTLTVVLTGETAGALTIVLTGDDSGTTASKAITVLNSSRIYNSNLLNKDSVSTTLGGSVVTNGVTWFTNDCTMQNEEDDFSTATDTHKGVGLGTAAKPVDTFELTSDLFVGEDYAGLTAHTISSIVVNASVAKDGSASLEVYLNGTKLGSTESLSESATDYVFTPASGYVGHITIKIANSAAKAVYLGSVIVKGTASTQPSGTFYTIAKELETIDSCNISESDWNTFLATEDTYYEKTYGELFDDYSSAFGNIVLWDHESKDSSSLKTSTFSAFDKYDYIQSRFDAGSGLRGLLNKVNTNSTTIIIVTISVLSLASIGAYFLLRKKKEVK